MKDMKQSKLFQKFLQKQNESPKNKQSQQFEDTKAITSQMKLNAPQPISKPNKGSFHSYKALQKQQQDRDQRRKDQQQKQQENYDYDLF